MSTPVSIPKKVKGKKSVFFKDPAIDQVMTFFIELLTEVSVLRDRIDTLEQLLEKNRVIAADAIEDYHHDEASEKRRAAARKALLERVIRMDQ